MRCAGSYHDCKCTRCGGPFTAFEKTNICDKCLRPALAELVAQHEKDKDYCSKSLECVRSVTGKLLASEERVKQLEGVLEKAEEMYRQIRAFGQLPGIANTDAEIEAEARAFDAMDEAADKFDATRTIESGSDKTQPIYSTCGDTHQMAPVARVVELEQELTKAHRLLSNYGVADQGQSQQPPLSLTERINLLGTRAVEAEERAERLIMFGTLQS